jgi:hypothetical protein
VSDSLATAMADFSAHKRAPGRKYQTEEPALRLLPAFAEQHGVHVKPRSRHSPHVLCLGAGGDADPLMAPSWRSPWSTTTASGTPT